MKLLKERQMSWLRIVDEEEEEERERSAQQQQQQPASGEVKENPATAAEATAAVDENQDVEMGKNGCFFWKIVQKNFFLFVSDDQEKVGDGYKADGDDDEKEDGDDDDTAPPPAKCNCQKRQRPKQKAVPLIDFLCKRYKCTVQELHVLFQNLQTRRAIIHLLRINKLRTNHIRPAYRNFNVNCNNLSTQSADDAFAMGGYLGITVCTFFSF